MGCILDNCDELQKEREGKSSQNICYLCNKSLTGSKTAYHNFCNVHYNCYCQDILPQNININRTKFLEIMCHLNKVISNLDDNYLWRELASIEAKLLEVSRLTPIDILENEKIKQK